MVHDILDKIDLLKKLKAEFEDERVHYEQVMEDNVAYGILTCINKLKLELVNLDAEFKYHEDCMWDQYQQEQIDQIRTCQEEEVE